MQLSHEIPPGIFKVPTFTGREQLFGFLRLGSGDNRLFFIALDILADGPAMLFLDLNQNGDLTDDPEPIPGRNADLFSAEIAIPFRKLAQQSPFPESFHIWVFTNSSLWPRRQLAHYSRTQLKGSVELDGVPYDAFLVDSGRNDADLTNDGICIDLDRNRKIEAGECIAPGKVLNVSGRRYSFEVEW